MQHLHNLVAGQWDEQRRDELLEGPSVQFGGSFWLLYKYAWAGYLVNTNFGVASAKSQDT